MFGVNNSKRIIIILLIASFNYTSIAYSDEDTSYEVSQLINESELVYENALGWMSLKINDVHGNLVGYLETSRIQILDHSITDKFFIYWESGGEILIDEVMYEILSYTTVLSPTSENHTISGSGLGFEYTQYGTKSELWIVTADHPQYRAMNDDVIISSYTVFLPIT